MKLNLAISSFGGQYWQNCVYALNTSDLSTINPAFNGGSPDRYCGGPGTDSTTEANFPGGTQPAGLTFIENTNSGRSRRPVQPVAQPRKASHPA